MVMSDVNHPLYPRLVWYRRVDCLLTEPARIGDGGSDLAFV